MNEDQIRVLRHNRPEIVRVLAGDSDLNYVIDRMDELGPRLEDGLEDREDRAESLPVTDWMRENIRSRNKPLTEKVRQFLDELERRGPGAYWCFLEALKDQHHFLHNTIVRSYTENDMRKYVSGDDLSTMGPNVVHIDDVRARSRSRCDSAANLKRSKSEQVKQATKEGGDPGMSTEAKKSSQDNQWDNKVADKKIERQRSEPSPSRNRSTHLAEMKTSLTVIPLAISTTELFEKKDNKELNILKCMSISGDTVRPSYLYTTCTVFLNILLGILGYFGRLLAALCNINYLVNHQGSNGSSYNTSADQGILGVALEKEDEVFIYIKQPACAVNKSMALAVTKYGKHVFLPQDSFKKCNDPRGEEWFFPVDDELPVVAEGQLHAILEGQPTGAFVVYKPEEPYHAKDDGRKHVYNLAVCYEHSIQTYPIYQYLNSQVGISDNEIYANICSLVKYHGLNRGSISCRLRLPYSRQKFNIEDHITGCPKIQLDNRGSEIIGIGYASEVKRVRDETGRCVALKVPRPSDVEAEGLQLDFLEEVKHMLSFKHANIVRSLGVYLADGLPHIVMDYHANGDVQRCLLQGTLASEDTPSMVEICVQTLSAIAYLKQRRVIHRDVAARNVLVANCNSQLVHVKLTDFGMSRFVRKDCYVAEKNEVVALRWAAPEVLTHLHYSTKSDIWAVGMFFYEVFSGGQEPYNTTADDQVLVTVVDKKEVPEQPKDCPTGLYALMMKCWQFTPADRPEVDGLLRCVRRNCRTSPASPRSTLEEESSQTEETGLGSRLENLYTLDSGSGTGGSAAGDKVKLQGGSGQGSSKKRKRKVGGNHTRSDTNP